MCLSHSAVVTMKQERRGLRGHLGRGEGEEWEADGSMVPAERVGRAGP